MRVLDENDYNRYNYYLNYNNYTYSIEKGAVCCMREVLRKHHHIPSCTVSVKSDFLVFFNWLSSIVCFVVRDVTLLGFIIYLHTSCK